LIHYDSHSIITYIIQDFYNLFIKVHFASSIKRVRDANWGIQNIMLN
jgi:hypothetical protein